MQSRVANDNYTRCLEYGVYLNALEMSLAILMRRVAHKFCSIVSRHVQECSNPVMDDLCVKYIRVGYMMRLPNHPFDNSIE